jgi:hypothetical protein
MWTGRGSESLRVTRVLLLYCGLQSGAPKVDSNRHLRLGLVVRSGYQSTGGVLCQRVLAMCTRVATESQSTAAASMTVPQVAHRGCLQVASVAPMVLDFHSDLT